MLAAVSITTTTFVYILNIVAVSNSWGSVVILRIVRKRREVLIVCFLLDLCPGAKLLEVASSPGVILLW